MKLYNNIVYTNKLILKRFAAVNLFFFILIRPGFEGDKELLAHELIHTKQMFRTFGFHVILYHISAKYRFEAECEAYAESVKYGELISDCATWVVRNYNLDVTYEEAHAKILEYCNKELSGE